MFDDDDDDDLTGNSGTMRIKTQQHIHFFLQKVIYFD